jgi:hypothetical protein
MHPTSGAGRKSPLNIEANLARKLVRFQPPVSASATARPN